MADSSVAISAGTGTPIRVLTGLGAGTADQQVVTLADQLGNLLPSAPDGTLSIDEGPSSLLFEAFDGTLTTQWTTGGTAPVQASGQLTFSAATTLSVTSYITSVNTLQLFAESYLHIGWVVQLDTNSALANSTRWWGWGANAATPVATAPITNGAVFMCDYATGQFMAAIYSAGTRTQSVNLTKPTDGAFHRYLILFRTARAYFLIDDVLVATIANPNPAVTNLQFLIAGSANFTTGPSSAPTMVASVASAADGQGNNRGISDGKLHGVVAAVKKASIASVAADPSLVIAHSPNSPLPAGTNALGTVNPSVGNTTGVTVTTATTTNATSTKASAGSVMALVVTNPTAATGFLKLYNKASAPTVGTDIPIMTFPVPATASPAVYAVGHVGWRFSTGIAWAMTLNATDADATVMGTAGVKVHITYI